MSAEFEFAICSYDNVNLIFRIDITGIADLYSSDHHNKAYLLLLDIFSDFRQLLRITGPAQSEQKSL